MEIPILYLNYLFKPLNRYSCGIKGDLNVPSTLVSTDHGSVMVLATQHFTLDLSGF